MDLRKHYMFLLKSATSSQYSPHQAHKRIASELSDWILYRKYWEETDTMEAMASGIGVPREELASLLHYWTGDVYMTLRKRLRINDAKEMLAQRPQMSIAQVARTVGFLDKSDFRKAFTEETGYPPRLWRGCRGNALRCRIRMILGEGRSRCPSRRKSA